MKAEKPGLPSTDQAPSTSVSAGMNQRFMPFYESMVERLPGPSSLIWKVVISVLVGAVFLIANYMTMHEQIFHDWIWLLSVMITASTLLLYYATATLLGMFPYMDIRLNVHGQTFERHNQTYFLTAKRTLANRSFAFWGLFFGVFNCVMGWIFGVPDLGFAGRVAIFGGFFLVGFICGMAALGTYGVLGMIKEFMRAEKLDIDYSAPDRCGGMLFLGEALVKFSSVTLVMGVLIAIFIVNFGWTGQNNIIVKGLMWFWIAFPFVVSLLVLLAPSAEINRALSDYKVNKEDEMDTRLAALRTLIGDPSVTADAREAARKDYEYHDKLRSEVYKMRTWPFGINSSVQYAAIFLSNAGAVAWKGVGKMIETKLG